MVVRSGGRGPAAARNTGWRAASGDWVVFLDDDVLPEPGWSSALRSDLAAAGRPGDDRLLLVVSQGRVLVPLPAHRRPTDTERNVSHLQGAAWITADLAVPRPLLAVAGGFDERFPRAYREDTDLALRLAGAGVRRLPGERTVLHPPAPAPWWASISRQRGNADDARMRRLHGSGWRTPGRRRARPVPPPCAWPWAASWPGPAPWRSAGGARRWPPAPAGRWPPPS